MGKSYVLKEKNERICGFVMQMGSNLSYRITHFVKKPLMLTAEALKGETGPVKILVTEPHQRMNVEKFAKSKGKKSTAVEKDGYYEVVIE